VERGASLATDPNVFGSPILARGRHPGRPDTYRPLERPIKSLRLFIGLPSTLPNHALTPTACVDHLT
jgi:hypothetical protein